MIERFVVFDDADIRDLKVPFRRPLARVFSRGPPVSNNLPDNTTGRVMIQQVEHVGHEEEVVVFNQRVSVGCAASEILMNEISHETARLQLDGGVWRYLWNVEGYVERHFSKFQRRSSANPLPVAFVRSVTMPSITDGRGAGRDNLDCIRDNFLHPDVDGLPPRVQRMRNGVSREEGKVLRPRRQDQSIPGSKYNRVVIDIGNLRVEDGNN